MNISEYATPTTAHPPPSLAELQTQALGAMQAAGLPFETLEPDSSWKRHPKQDAFWYNANSGTGRTGRPWLQVSAGDARIAGGVDTATFTWKSWTDSGAALDPGEVAEIHRQLEAAAQQRQAQQEQSRQAAAAQAADAWGKANPDCNGHPYLQNKGVQAHGIRRLGVHLLVPVADTQGRLHGLQSIHGDGSKKFNPDAAVTGHFHLLGTPGKRLYLAEGYATAATIHEATGEAVAASFHCGNLKPVAEALRQAHPALELILCADNDRWTEGNPGLTKATAAAQAVGAALVVPAFTDTSSKPTDLNDLARLQGMDEVRRQLGLAQRVEAGDDWPEPQPLPDGLAPVEPFAFELLPRSLLPWVRDICERVQCPPDFVGAAAIAALAAVLGRKLAIRPQERTDWAVVGNVWALVIGRPGLLKSPALEAALAPLKRLQAQANETHEAAAKDYERDKAVAKLRAAAAEKKAQQILLKDPRADVGYLLEREATKEPTLHRYLANDTTAAALGELLRQNSNGLLVHRDEIASLLQALDREDNAEARGFYLTSWAGDSGYTFDRITRGMNLHIPAVCLSLLGSTQPGRIARYIRQAVCGGAGDDGLIQRFGLLVWPDTGGDWREVDRWPNSEARREAFTAFGRLDQLDPQAVGAVQDTGFNGEPDGPPYLRFDEPGLELFREWRQDLEAKLRSGELHPALESHLAKYRKLVPGLALLLHLADGNTGPVGRQPVLQALGWAEYLESHAKRAYGAVTAPEVDAAQAILFRLQRGELKPQFSSRDVWRPGWASLTDRDVVLDALLLLADLDWLSIEKQQTKGRTATLYTANPRARP